MIFKKHISILIAFLILVSNSGMAFNVHYCEGKIASITSVFSKEEVCDTSISELAKQKPIEVEKACCAKPETSHKKCCSDKEVNLKNKTEKISSKTISLDFEPAFFIVFKNHVFSVDFSQNFVPEKVAFYCESHAPPLYKLYCQYTFYS